MLGPSALCELATPMQYYIARVCYKATAREGTCDNQRATAVAERSAPRTTPSDQEPTWYRAKCCYLSKTSVSALMKDFKGFGVSVQQWLHELPPARLYSLSRTATERGEVQVSVDGVACELVPRHLELQESLGGLGWVRAGTGWLTASGAPSKHTVKSWAREGVTCVISLLRQSEPHFDGARDACRRQGFRWEHVPLSGKGALTNPGEDDLRSWERLRKLMPELLRDEEHIVVHCAAGMHRTGGAAYSSLRRCGYSSGSALDAMGMMRAITHAELLKIEKHFDQPLWAVADGLLCTDIA